MFYVYHGGYVFSAYAWQSYIYVFSLRMALKLPKVVFLKNHEYNKLFRHIGQG